VSGLRIAVLFLILVAGLLVVLLVTAGLHELRAALFGFLAGVLVARLGSAALAMGRSKGRLRPPLFTPA
jgi:hypothetical protein